MKQAVVRVIAYWVVALSALACERAKEASAVPRERAPAVVSPSTPPPASPAPRRGTIVFMGTSLTAGLGLDPEQAFPALVAHRIEAAGENYDVVNAGVSGETSAGALRRASWVFRGPVDVLVLETGANDGLRALPVDSMHANIQHILDSLHARHPSARVVLAGMQAPPNLGPAYTAAFRAAFADLARRNDAALIPFLLAGVAGVDSLNQPDGIHPNAAGERIVAENVWRVLEPVLHARGTPALGSRPSALGLAESRVQRAESRTRRS